MKKPDWWYLDDWQYQLRKDREVRRRKLIDKILKVLKLKP
jgi:hypothetical protein